MLYARRSTITICGLLSKFAHVRRACVVVTRAYFLSSARVSRRTRPRVRPLPSAVARAPASFSRAVARVSWRIGRRAAHRRRRRSTEISARVTGPRDSPVKPDPTGSDSGWPETDAGFSGLLERPAARPEDNAIRPSRESGWEGGRGGGTDGAKWFLRRVRATRVRDGLWLHVQQCPSLSSITHRAGISERYTLSQVQTNRVRGVYDFTIQSTRTHGNRCVRFDRHVDLVKMDRPLSNAANRVHTSRCRPRCLVYTTLLHNNNYMIEKHDVDLIFFFFLFSSLK